VVCDCADEGWRLATTSTPSLFWKATREKTGKLGRKDQKLCGSGLFCRVVDEKVGIVVLVLGRGNDSFIVLKTAERKHKRV